MLINILFFLFEVWVRMFQLIMISIACLYGVVYNLFAEFLLDDAVYYDWDDSLMKYMSEMVGCLYLILWFSLKYKRKIIIYRSWYHNDVIINNENFDLENNVNCDLEKNIIDQIIKSKLFFLKMKTSDLSKINHILYFK